MAEKIDTWMPLLIDKYLGDTTHLSTEQHGAYLLLLMSMWKRGGSLPKDDKQLRSITRLDVLQWREHRSILLAFFTAEGSCLRQKRLTEEMVRAESNNKAKAESGKKGATSKWGKSSEDRQTRAERLAAARAKGSHTQHEWAALCEVLGESCVMCGVHRSSLEGESLTKDHILPIYQGGDDSIENLQPMCRNCNSRKGSDSRDMRVTRIPDWRERLAKRLAKRLADASLTPAPIPTPKDLAALVLETAPTKKEFMS